MAFVMNLLPRTELTDKTTDAGRLYELPDGTCFPSVTTVLGRGPPKGWLTAWKSRVGEREAERASGLARRKGSAVHRVLECYLACTNMVDAIMPDTMAAVKTATPAIDAHVSEVLGIELPLHSYRLRTAGRCDALVEWDDYLTVLDYKTTNPERAVGDDTVHGYALQATAYALMVEEMYRRHVPRVVILVINGYDPARVLTLSTDDHRREVIDVFTSRDWELTTPA